MEKASQALDSLNELTAALLEGEPLPALMQRTAAAARVLLEGAGAWVCTATDDGRGVMVLAEDREGADLPDQVGQVFPIRGTLAGRILRDREPVIVADVSHPESGASDAGRALGLGPAVGVPLSHGERDFGSLIVAARPGRSGYGPEDLATARMFARSAAVALGLAAFQSDLADLAALYEHSPDGVLLTRPDSGILAANPAARRMLRMDEEQLKTAGSGGITAGNGTEAGGGSAGEEAPTRSRLDVTYRRGDGTTFVGEVTSVTISDRAGDPRSWVIFRDVTRRRRTEASLRGITELTLALLAREPIGGILTRTAALARGLVDGAAAYLVTVVDADRDLAVVAAEDAPGAPSLLGLDVRLSESLAGQALLSERSLVVDDLSADPRTMPEGRALGLASTLVVPLVHGGRRLGALVVAADPAAAPYETEDLAAVEMFARSAALAIDLSDIRAALAITEERERIARELHDRVIQHLFGTGVGLQAAVGQSAVHMSDRITGAVRAIDQIIDEIRGTIFDLTR